MSECKYAKSDMTPCYLRDGKTTAIAIGGQWACVGCERTLDSLDATTEGPMDELDSEFGDLTGPVDRKRHGAEDHICEDCWNDASEPGVLERLRDDLLSLKLLLKDDGLPRVSRVDLGKFSKDVADAIAEIKRLGKLVDELHCTNIMLRAITDAEPVAWQFQMARFGHNESPRWHTCTRETFEQRRAEGHKTRVLAVVAPKGDG